MEPHLLVIQARVLQWIGLSLLFLGLYLGHDPLVAAWRASAGALIAMMAAGYFLRQILGVIEERMVNEEAERQLQETQAATAPGGTPGKANTSGKSAGATAATARPVSTASVR